MTNRLHFLTLLSILSILLWGCASVPAPVPTPTPGTPLPPTPTSLPQTPPAPFTFSGQTKPLLLAHYMPWFQTPKVSGKWGYHWTLHAPYVPSQDSSGAWRNLASHYTPLTGPYDSSDEQVLDYQVQLMKLSGIDGVIVDWYGSEYVEDYGLINDATARLFHAIQKAGLKFVICYEDQTIPRIINLGANQDAEAVKHGQMAMAYLRDTWFKQDAYLKVGGQPVLLVFGPQYFKDASQWKELFSVLEPQPLLITIDKRINSFAAGSFPWPPMWISKGGELGQGAMFNYLTEFYASTGKNRYKVGSAFPGFSDFYKEGNAGESYGHLDDQGGATFRLTLQEALQQNLDLIQLVTWNDYGEGTIIEPTVQFEYRYLEMVQEAQKALSGGNFPFKATDLRLPLRLYNLRLRYAADASASADLAKAGEAIQAGDLDAARTLMSKFK